MSGFSIKPANLNPRELKRRLDIAKQRYSLLNDKRGLLAVRYMECAKEGMRLRSLIEEKLGDAFKQFMPAYAIMSPTETDEAFAYSLQKTSLEVSYAEYTSVKTPLFKLNISNEALSALPYSLASTYASIDNAVTLFYEALPLLVGLAEAEKSCDLLAHELEMVRRRVKALEQITIPELENLLRPKRTKATQNEHKNANHSTTTKKCPDNSLAAQRD